MNLIIKAARLAAKAHEGQKRDVTGDPYIFHPGRVASRVTLLDGVDGLVIGEDEVAAAWCHDVAEDTTTTIDDIERELNPNVAEVRLTTACASCSGIWGGQVTFRRSTIRVTRLTTRFCASSKLRSKAATI